MKHSGSWQGGGRPFLGLPTSTPLVHKGTHYSQRTLPCPDCHAAIGEPCISNLGNVKSKSHLSRHRLVMRAHFAELEAQRDKEKEA